MLVTGELKIQLGNKRVIFRKLGKHLLCHYSFNTAFEQGRRYNVFNVLQWVRFNRRG